jgi:predicted alpha/beta-hydrolase family hydrolase
VAAESKFVSIVPMDANITPYSNETLNPGVRGFLHSPIQANGHGLVLTHGAGGNCNASLLIALAEEFTANGWTALRMDLPFRQERRFGPPFPGNAERDRDGLRNAVRAIRALGVVKIFLGGHSYGGRQSSMLCAEDPGLTSGLLLLSYPLHPPRKPEQMRIQHLPNLRTPSFFVHGTRDPFATTEEMNTALALIPARKQLLEVEGAGHDLGFKGKSARAELTGLIVERFVGFIGKS